MQERLWCGRFPRRSRLGVVLGLSTTTLGALGVAGFALLMIVARQPGPIIMWTTVGAIVEIVYLGFTRIDGQAALTFAWHRIAFDGRRAAGHTELHTTWPWLTIGAER